MSQVRKLNENSNRRYQFYDRRIKNLLRKIHTDSREKPDKNTSEVSRSDGAPPLHTLHLLYVGTKATVKPNRTWVGNLFLSRGYFSF